MDVMADNLKGIPFSSPDEGVDYPKQARAFVQVETKEFDAEKNEETFLPLSEIYITSFTYILGGWKAMVSTSVPDGKYYEVTHNTSKQETYVDTYIKVQNTKYSLEGEPNA